MCTNSIINKQKNFKYIVSFFLSNLTSWKETEAADPAFVYSWEMTTERVRSGKSRDT